MAKRILEEIFCVFTESTPSSTGLPYHTRLYYLEFGHGTGKSHVLAVYVYCSPSRVTLKWMAYVAYGTMRHLSEDTGPGGG